MQGPSSSSRMFTIVTMHDAIDDRQAHRRIKWPGRKLSLADTIHEPSGKSQVNGCSQAPDEIVRLADYVEALVNSAGLPAPAMRSILAARRDFAKEAGRMAEAKA